MPAAGHAAAVLMKKVAGRSIRTNLNRIRRARLRGAGVMAVTLFKESSIENSRRAR